LSEKQHANKNKRVNEGKSPRLHDTDPASAASLPHIAKLFFLEMPDKPAKSMKKRYNSHKVAMRVFQKFPGFTLDAESLPLGQAISHGEEVIGGGGKRGLSIQGRSQRHVRGARRGAESRGRVGFYQAA
jgi:hypothetical protein